MDQEQIVRDLSYVLDDLAEAANNDSYVDAARMRVKSLQTDLKNGYNNFQPVTTMWYILETQVQEDEETRGRHYTEVAELRLYATEEEAHRALGKLAFAKASNIGGMCSERYDFAWGSIRVQVPQVTKGGDSNGSA